MKAKFVVLCLSLFLATALFAREKNDVIVMKNGDRITCEIKGLTADTLYISVDYILSTSSVDWSKVDRVESKQLFIVKTQNGLVYSGSLSTPATPGGRPIMIQVRNPLPTKRCCSTRFRSSRWMRLPPTSGNASMAMSVWA